MSTLKDRRDIASTEKFTGTIEKTCVSLRISVVYQVSRKMPLPMRTMVAPSSTAVS